MNVKQKIWAVYGKYQRNGLYRKTKKRIELRSKRVGSERYLDLKNYFEDLYFVQEYGIKTLAKQHDMTYSNMRGLLEFLEIEIRKGHNVVTDRLRTFRKEKAIYESENKIGFNDPSLIRKYEGLARGVQGYYYNESREKLVWLRSTWEYIFAQWLDRTGHIWDTEVTHYEIKDSTYRPDFFIYDENENLTKIIELKGYWDNNSDKASILNERLGDIEVVVIREIESFLENGKTYHQKLSEWKEKRITKDGKSKINKNL